MPVIRDEDRKNGVLSDAFAFLKWGLGVFKAGEECDYHYHDCDEYWFIVRGRAVVTEDGIDYEVGPGDVLFTPMGKEHKIRAITDCEEFWLELPLQGKKRTGHLHRKGND